MMSEITRIAEAGGGNGIFPSQGERLNTISGEYEIAKGVRTLDWCYRIICWARVVAE